MKLLKARVQTDAGLTSVPISHDTDLIHEPIDVSVPSPREKPTIGVAQVFTIRRCPQFLPDRQVDVSCDQVGPNNAQDLLEPLTWDLSHF